jgi:type III secretion protein S
MTESDFVAYLNQGLLLVLLLSLPTIVVASVVGVVFSLLQALTQIQEQTLSFAVKLIAVSVVLLLTASWMGGEIYNYTVATFDAIGTTKQ